MSEFTTAQVFAGISAALADGDMPMVVSLVHVLAVRDPDSAQMILDALEVIQ